MSSRFTEQETEIYYDSEDAIYRSFWDENGSVHWGVFDESTGDDFLKASLTNLGASGEIYPSDKKSPITCANSWGL